ncbi:hypothetical protein HWV62_26382 [Athelia sp. TMB]|nr:hypothetical protein HWV62_26382 [Athelia sp. TMB]
MACSPTPTATLFGVTTEFSETTTFSYSTSALPSTVTTIVVDNCVAAANVTACNSTGVAERVSTIPGEQVTYRVPYVATVTQTNKVATETLFASCSSSEPHSTSSPASVDAPPSPVPHASAPASSTTVPAHLAENTADGTVAITTVYKTSTPTPSVVFVTAPPGSSTTVALQSNSGFNDTRSSIGPIIGGVIAGFLALVAIVGVAWFIIRKRHAWRDIYGRDTPSPETPSIRPSSKKRSSTRKSLDMLSELEPKPYQYGVVGSLNRTPSLLSHNLSIMSAPLSPTQEYLGRRRSASPEVEYGSRSLSPQTPVRVRTSVSGHGHGSPTELSFDAQQLYRQHSQDPFNRRHSARSSLALNASLYTQPSVGTRPLQGSRRSKSSGTTPSRPSTGGSMQSTVSAAGSVAPMVPRPRLSSTATYVPLDLPDEFGAPSAAATDDRVIAMGRDGEPIKPDLKRTLTLTNWNPSTDAISIVEDTRRTSRDGRGSVDAPALTCVTEDVPTNGMEKPPPAHTAP